MKKIITLLLLFISLNILAYDFTNKQDLEQYGSNFYLNGQLFSGKAIYNRDRLYFVNGRAEGKWISFYNNGNIKSIANWKDGHLNGKYIIYQEDGTKILETTYLDGKEEGSYLVFHSNGTLRIEGAYKLGQAIGKWKYYNESGKLIGETQM